MRVLVPQVRVTETLSAEELEAEFEHLQDLKRMRRSTAWEGAQHEAGSPKYYLKPVMMM